MMNTGMNSYIEKELAGISGLSTLEKFDLLYSLSNAISQNISNPALIKMVIGHIEALRYEMAYNKGIEAISYRLDKVLAYETLKLSRIIYKGQSLTKAINDVLYYETNEEIKEALKKELENESD